MRTLAIVSFGLMLAFAAPAAAQIDQQQNPDSQALKADKCRAQTQQGGKQPPGGNLTDKMVDCGGVLKPPATGDREMTAPAPDEGKTPVINPGDVPAQPPAQ